MKQSVSINQFGNEMNFVTKIKSRLSAWLKSENLYLSSTVGESVTNKQALLIGRCFVSFFFMSLSADISLLLCLIGLLWFSLSLLSVKRSIDNGRSSNTL